MNSPRFGRGVRLLCNSCGTISNNHPADDDKGIVCNGRWLVYYKCKCGNEDQDNFTDSGNFESECTSAASYEKMEEIEILRARLKYMEDQAEAAWQRWEYLWNNEDDVLF